MRASAWWRSLAGAAACGCAAGGTPGCEQDAQPRAGGAPPRATQAPETAPGATSAVGGGHAGRLAGRPLVIRGGGREGRRRLGSEQGGRGEQGGGVGAGRAPGGGACGQVAGWGPVLAGSKYHAGAAHGGTTRVMEVTLARQTGTALSWFSDFAESMER
eukprot:5401097-Pleurochrysis_carterae.AAC.1